MLVATILPRTRLERRTNPLVQLYSSPTCPLSGGELFPGTVVMPQLCPAALRQERSRTALLQQPTTDVVLHCRSPTPEHCHWRPRVLIMHRSLRFCTYACHLAGIQTCCLPSHWTRATNHHCQLIPTRLTCCNSTNKTCPWLPVSICLLSSRSLICQLHDIHSMAAAQQQSSALGAVLGQKGSVTHWMPLSATEMSCTGILPLKMLSKSTSPDSRPSVLDSKEMTAEHRGSFLGLSSAMEEEHGGKTGTQAA